MQYVFYLAKAYPQHEFKILDIAQQIKRIESNTATFDETIAEIRRADGVLWGFPLYFLLVHAHYKRFIELIFERGVEDAFAGKYAATLSTSIHYFDHTAHNYMQAISDDLGMRFVESYSADMSDLLKESERKRLVAFGKHFLDAMANAAPAQRQIPNLREVLQAHAEFQAANLVGLIGDEHGSGDDIDRNIDYTMAQAVQYALAAYSRPLTFLGVGGMKLFRDDIWGRLRPIFPADHRAFEKLGLYNTFPQADLRGRLTNAIALPILSIPPIKKGFKRQIKKQMVAPLKKMVESFTP